MGGINHQPCRNYFRESTEWSRNLSVAESEFHLANIALEDVILGELDGEIISVQEIVSHLEKSYQALNSAWSNACTIQEKMKMLNFQDFDCIADSHFDYLGKILSSQGVVSHFAWDEVLSCIRKNGFQAVVENSKKQIEDIMNATKRLMDCVDMLSPGNIIDVMEENRPENIRIPFGYLYCSRSFFMQSFLASSIISSEAWYLSRGHESFEKSFEFLTSSKSYLNLQALPEKDISLTSSL